MTSPLLNIIQCSEKRKLEKMCKVTTISMSEFVDFILACKTGLTHLNHIMHYVDFVPLELEVQQDDWNILKGDATELATKEGQQAFRRVTKQHGKRQYRVGHMFISKELAHPIREWHFFFYEINELSGNNNHWEKGAHVHLTNYLWPNLYCQNIWERFINAKEFPKAKLHLSVLDEKRTGF